MKNKYKQHILNFKNNNDLVNEEKKYFKKLSELVI